MPPELNLERLSLVSGVDLALLEEAQRAKQEGHISQKAPGVGTFEDALVMIGQVSDGLPGTDFLIRLIELWDGGQSVPFGA
ncbi:MAG: hypothetical protein ACOYS2_01060 [Patescibacteria group bacterium]